MTTDTTKTTTILSSDLSKALVALFPDRLPAEFEGWDAARGINSQTIRFWATRRVDRFTVEKATTIFTKDDILKAVEMVGIRLGKVKACVYEETTGREVLFTIKHV